MCILRELDVKTQRNMPWFYHVQEMNLENESTDLKETEIRLSNYTSEVREG